MTDEALTLEALTGRIEATRNALSLLAREVSNLILGQGDNPAGQASRAAFKANVLVRVNA
jgi:hypothetical protein